jgi:hypothetical protein
MSESFDDGVNAIKPPEVNLENLVLNLNLNKTFSINNIYFFAKVKEYFLNDLNLLHKTPVV